jgi:hypothetical protein
MKTVGATPPDTRNARDDRDASAFPGKSPNHERFRACPTMSPNTKCLYRELPSGARIDETGGGGAGGGDSGRRTWETKRPRRRRRKSEAEAAEEEVAEEQEGGEEEEEEKEVAEEEVDEVAAEEYEVGGRGIAAKRKVGKEQDAEEADTEEEEAAEGQDEEEEDTDEEEEEGAAAGGEAAEDGDNLNQLFSESTRCRRAPFLPFAGEPERARQGRSHPALLPRHKAPFDRRRNACEARRFGTKSSNSQNKG